MLVRRAHNICMKPHKLDVVKQGAHVHYYFVIGNAEYLTPGCHACPGSSAYSS